ncbi:hypothetical protein ACLB2K_065797 [Fragaria x ananassa]
MMAEKYKSKLYVQRKMISDAEESKSTVDDLALPLEKLNLGPEKKKKLLVIGLGGLLCHRVYRTEKLHIPKHRRPDAAYGNYKVYKRPYCEEFMKFCLERFEVGIWSSAREWYLDNALDCVMTGLRRKLLFAWAHTAIFPDEYKVDQVDDKALGAQNVIRLLCILRKVYVQIVLLGPNGELRLHLEGLADADDVTSYVKENPFGHPAISTTHSDWEFYSKIINAIELETFK